jgi:hypothetical protein
MKPATHLLSCLLVLLVNNPSSASLTLDQFYGHITGKWYVTRGQGGITGETINYYPLPADSVIITRINGTDSIRITGYNNSNLLSNDKFRVIWSNNFNDWQLSSNDREIHTELLPDFLKIFQTENITTFSRIESYMFSGNTDAAAAIMEGRWYFTAIGSGSFEMDQIPGSGDSITISAKDASDSIKLTYYQDCKPELSDKYRLVIDSSWSLQADALMLVNNSEINRILVWVNDSSLILRTDSMPGHYLILSHIDTFHFYKPPLLSSVTGDSACVSGDLALQAESDPGEIRWYSEPDGGIPIAYGNVFFPGDISETTTYYVDAIYNGCVTDGRIPVVAVIACPTTVGQYLQDENIIAFPDPTSGKFEIRSEQPLHLNQVIICNETGIALRNFMPDSYPVRMDIAELPKGLYFIVLLDNSSVHVLKIIKQ